MDSLTHIVLGACIGEVWLEKKIGKRALFLGAVAQSVPDIDFLASFFLSPADDLLAHRAFTHSILFVLLVAPLLAWLADRWRRPHDVAFSTWIGFFATEMLVHIFIDASNGYGTGWFEPFSHYRISFNSMFVIDILFSIVPFIAFLLLVFSDRKHRLRKKWALAAIGWCGFYFLLGIAGKMVVEKPIAAMAAKQHITYKRHFTTPAPFNNMLWYTVLESDSGFYIGYRSVFDGKRDMSFHFFPRQEYLLNQLNDQDEVNKLIRFSQGYYTIEQQRDTLVFNDLRFEQMRGWYDPASPFVFHYYLKDTTGNDMVVQRGRFSGWNTSVMSSLWRRMWGGEK